MQRPRRTAERGAAPTALQSVLNSIARTAARLCEARDARITLLEGDHLRLVAFTGAAPVLPLAPYARAVDRRTPAGHAMLDRRVVHVRDMQVAARRQYTAFAEVVRGSGMRTVLVAPLLRGGGALGAILVRRDRVKPFTAKQISLLEAFADQAAIAIENARLSEELGSRNRELTAALEQQTASSEILKAISGAQTDATAVFESIARSAVRLCGAFACRVFRAEGEQLPVVGEAYGTPEARVLFAGTHSEALGSDSPSATAIRERRVVHYADVPNDPDVPERYRERARARGYRALMAVPMVRDGVALGSIAVVRQEPVPFPEHHVELLKTFADQAVVAIENVRLFTELEARNRQLTEALEQQTATGDILRVISSSPTNLQPVFDIIARNATRLCGGLFSGVSRFDGELIHMMATYNYSPEALEFSRRRFPSPPGRHTFAGRTILERAVVHVADVLADPDAGGDLLPTGFRSVLSVPMLRGGDPIGAITIWRAAVGPFSESQVELLRTFADQAVIAIENARLFAELESRNHALTEALSQQTATAEILRVISGSPTDVRPVFDAILASATRLCEAEYGILFLTEGEDFRAVAFRNTSPEFMAVFKTLRRFGPRSGVGRLARDKRPVHIPDLIEDDAYREGDPARLATVNVGGVRTWLGVPLLKGEVLIGAIIIYRKEPRAFSDPQIALVQTFADQAVIAIENVRLFTELEARNQELTEALEQRTATAEILRVISSSPTDLAPVFDAILESATRLCGAHVGLLGLIQDGHYRPMADRGTTPEFRRWWYEPRSRFPDPRTGVGRMLHERRPIHIPDLTAEPLYRERDAVRVATVELAGARTFLAVPMLKEGRVVGGIVIYRPEVRPFTDQQIALVQTFANQAVIAIENVRLFNELQARTQELTRSVEQLTALGDVGQAISSTLDLETVLTTIVSRALQLTASDGGTIFEYDEPAEQFHQRATEGVSVVLETEAQWRDVGDLFRPWANARRSPLSIKKGEGVVGRLPETRKPIQVSDIAAAGAYDGPLRNALLESGIRAVLTVPLLREDRLVGALTVNRRTAGVFSPEVIELLTTFAAQSAIAIHNARLFRELEAKGRELAEASRHKSRFLANMSHELRTPMNAILGYTELIADGIYGDVPAPMREVVERVGASGRHLLGLINDVLDLSKIEAGQLTLTLADYSMKEVVEAVVAAVEGLAAEKRLRLIVDLAPALPTGRGDQRRLAQVLLNLVGNAIKFTEQGHVAIRVGVAADLFTVAVSDTGAGIAPADQERIFEEFQQADTSTTRPKGGTGLGLAIARQIVSMHGGRLWVESVLGEGATFRFTMPVRVEQPVIVRAGAP